MKAQSLLTNAAGAADLVRKFNFLAKIFQKPFLSQMNTGFGI